MGLSWEDFLIENAKFENLNSEAFEIFRKQAIFSGRINKTNLKISNEELLNSLNLIENNKLKRAAVLLFHKNPEKWIPGSYIKIGYFETDSNLIYQDEVHGPLLVQIEKTMELIYTKYLKAKISYNGITRVV